MTDTINSLTRLSRQEAMTTKNFTITIKWVTFKFILELSKKTYIF